MVEGLCTGDFGVDDLSVNGVGIRRCGWMGFCEHGNWLVRSFNVWSGWL